ncbi:MAG TPA: biotin/lipoate A/B protein ligase family protein [Verrucomicrobiae bacterium]|nr:biotin/lipoate A/B protein ligase family protein [Verrucomicrobiae bacterium]
MTETWDFLRSPAADAATNMALDEALLRTAAARGRPLLRLYSWSRPAISIGYFQKFPTHLVGAPHLNPLPAGGERRFPSPFVKGEGQGEGFDQIVRRSTGGGLVYHGDGVDTTYTVVVPPDHRLYTMSTPDAYCAIHQAVARAIGNGSQITDHQSPLPRTGYDCFQNPVHGDVVADGKKLAGAAQRRTKWGMLHQGSIAASVTAEALRRGFTHVLGVEFEVHKCSAAERALAEKLTREKYAAAAWNRR